MCLYIDDIDTVEDLAQAWRTARKPHTCAECRRTIAAGERYWAHDVVQRGLGGADDRAVTWRMCAHCRLFITTCDAITDCGEVWYWTSVLDKDEEIGVVANALYDDGHDLDAYDHRYLLRLWATARRGWRWRDGTLMDPPPNIGQKAPA